MRRSTFASPSLAHIARAFSAERLLVRGAGVGQPFRSEVLERPAACGVHRRVRRLRRRRCRRARAAPTRIRRRRRALPRCPNPLATGPLLTARPRPAARWPAAVAAVVLQVEAVADLGEHLAELLDLVVGVRRGDLDAEADLVLRAPGDRRRSSRRCRGRRGSGRPRRCPRGGRAAPRSPGSRTGWACRCRARRRRAQHAVRSCGRSRSARGRRARRSPRARRASVASDATGDGPEYRYGGAATFRTSFRRVGSARNESSELYDLLNPATKIMLS